MSRKIIVKKTKNLDIYGAAPIPWSCALKQLDAGTGGTYWLATTNPDGRPHVAAVGALWVDGRSISRAVAGIDLVVEGSAVRVTDRPTVLRLAKRYAAQGWPASVSGGALTAEYSAPSAGPPPWSLYVVRPTTAFGVATPEPSGAMRWKF